MLSAIHRYSTSLQVYPDLDEGQSCDHFYRSRLRYTSIAGNGIAGRSKKAINFLFIAILKWILHSLVLILHTHRQASHRKAHQLFYEHESKGVNFIK